MKRIINSTLLIGVVLLVFEVFYYNMPLIPATRFIPRQSGRQMILVVAIAVVIILTGVINGVRRKRKR